ncbi:MAG: DNA methyltransferase [Bacteroidia bacterium]|nr:MAG: DNA methyltransferase [Bacteroidia bacterium]PIE86525.1 MAG: DNA methyltransferase [Bacteroidia bacterium]
MRYIGNKENLLPQIYEIFQQKNIQGKSFFDVFSGTANVSKYFKKLNYQIFSSDLMYFSYVLQKAYICNNEDCQFEKLLKKLNFRNTKLFCSPLEIVVEYLNKIEPQEGFIYQNYTPEPTQHLEKPRMYFSSENGKIIDAIRLKIEQWKRDKLLTENEYFILLACLIETVPFYANIAGVFAAFHKKWDARAIKKMELRTISLFKNNYQNFVFNKNSVDLVSQIKADIYYLDPPYNQRQYAPNYHLLETIAKYDNPTIKGVSGMRDYSEQKSKFCNAKTALQELEKIAKLGNYKYLVLSYNSEGIMPEKDIINALAKNGNIELVEFDHLRFKSNNNGQKKHKKYIKEQLYILKR